MLIEWVEILLMSWWAWITIGIGTLNTLFVIALVIGDRRSSRPIAENRRQLRKVAWRKGILPAHEAHQTFEEE